MGGKSSQETRANSTTQQDPWALAMPDLKQAFAAIGPQWNNVNPTGNENNAFAGLEANARRAIPTPARSAGWLMICCPAARTAPAWCRARMTPSRAV
jgi:hypothetical protein